MRQRAYDGGQLGADGGADGARSPSRLSYRLQKSTNLRMLPSPRDFSDGPQTARDICLQKSTKIYMRTCAREFRRGRPSARYKAARNGPAPEKERHFGAFSLPRFTPFPSHISRSVRPRSGRCPDRASDSCPLPTYMQPDPDSVGPAIDPASLRSDFYRADSGTPDRIGFLTRPRFRCVDLGTPDPRLPDRESDADPRSDRIPRSTCAVRSDPPDPSVRRDRRISL